MQYTYATHSDPGLKLQVEDKKLFNPEIPQKLLGSSLSIFLFVW